MDWYFRHKKRLFINVLLKTNNMDTKTELLLDYQEMAILALREEVNRLTLENQILTLKLKANELL